LLDLKLPKFSGKSLAPAETSPEVLEDSSNRINDFAEDGGIEEAAGLVATLTSSSLWSSTVRKLQFRLKFIGAH
jgi:hypothetical protein